MDYDWAELPKHLLDSVIKKLKSSKDYLQFGCVCLSWRSIMLNDSQAIEENKRTKVPLLLVPNINDQHIWRLYDVMAHRYLKSTLSIPYKKRFCGSSQGWLVFVNDDWSVSLHNPFSNQHSTIRLPCLFPPDLEGDYNVDITQVYDYHVNKAYITTDPATNPKKCRVIVIFEEYCQVAFIKLTQETQWTVIEDDESMTNVDDIMQYNKKLYSVDCGGELCSFDVTDSKKPVVDRVTEILSELIDRNRYIVEVNGNLLQVERVYTYDIPDCKRRETLGFRILQLDFIDKKWVQILSLGECSLFLGVNSSVSVKASDVKGCQKNCIYFTHDIDMIHSITPMVCDLGRFDLEIGEFEAIEPLMALNMMTTRPPIWIVPTFNIN